jgi:hypothetical protein
MLPKQASQHWGHMPEGRRWKNASEQEDWLRAKGKVLGFTTQALANRLRDQFPSLPVQVWHTVHGYITPVAAEYVRRTIWRETILSDYEKAQLHVFTLRTHAYVISHYKGHLPNAEQCIAELLAAPMPLADPAFFTRMHRVTPIFDEIFLHDDLDHNIDHETVFAGAFVGQVLRIVKERSGVALNIGDQESIRIMEAFDTTARSIRQLLAN